MRSVREARLVLFVVALGLLTTVAALAGDLADFEQARILYTNGQYEQAAKAFGELLDAKGPKALESANLIEQARTYRAASLIALNRVEEADAEIEKALRSNPNAFPDPVTFPSVVQDRFALIRGRIREELEAKAREQARQERLRIEAEQARLKKEQERVAKLEELAGRETHVVHNSRWIAGIPFGVGQFQNRQDTLGWVFLTSEAALVTTTIVTSAIAQDLSPRGTEPNVDKADLNDRISTLKTVNNYAFAAFVLTAVGGVVHAQLTYVPSTQEEKKRELPDELRPTPVITAVEGGAMFGINGSF